MFRVSTHGDWDNWIEFCLRGTEAMARQAVHRCHELNLLREEMHAKLDALPRMGTLIENMFVSPVFSALEVARWANTSPPTARRDIETLVASAYVDYLDGLRPKIYYVPKIFDIAYPDEG